MTLTTENISPCKNCRCAYCQSEGTIYRIKFESVTETFCSIGCADKYCEQYKAKKEGRLVL